MPTLIDYLIAFNSKERFFLVGKALGNPTFSPSDGFLGELGNELKDELDDAPIPSDSFSAMDYHIDWLYASLKLAQDGESIIPYSRDYNGQRIIKGQQEDIDWIMAYRDGNKHHIILIEAKGVTGWTNKQMTSKAERFDQIFGKNGKNWRDIEPHFVMVSPERPPKALDLCKWPDWMMPNKQIHWLPLCIPHGYGLKKIVRCTEGKNEDSEGDHWKIESRKHGETE
jgi:hypothetical protein